MSYTPENPDAHFEDTPNRFLFVLSLENVQEAMCPLLGVNTRDASTLIEPLTNHLDYVRAVTEELLADDYGDIGQSVIQNTLAELTGMGRNLFEIFIDKTPVRKANIGFVEPVPEMHPDEEPGSLDKEEAVDFIVEKYSGITAINIRNVLEASLTNPL